MKVYIVEDDESMRMILKRLLRKNFPFLTDFAESESAEKALQEIPLFCPDLILVDISLPGMDGIELIRKLNKNSNSFGILVVTGHEIEVYEKDAREAGADDIVSKSDDKQFLDAVNALLKRLNSKNVS